MFGEGCADESSCSGSTIRSPVDFVWDAMRGERTGGPEPHAARDGWIAIRRSGHTSEHCSRSAPAGWSQEFRSTASSVCNPSSYPRSQAYTCLAKALADLHQHPAPTAGKHNPWKIALGVNMGYEMSQAKNISTGLPCAHLTVDNCPSLPLWRSWSACRARGNQARFWRAPR